MQIYQRLSSKAKAVVFATTTPVANVTQSLGRSWQGAVDYNTAAVAALKSASAARPSGAAAVVIDNLWTVIVKACGFGYTSCPLQLPANVHFTPAGQLALGTAVSNTILAVLGMLAEA